MELKKAYEVLGVPEDCNIDEVEKRFDILVRRMHAQSSDNSADSSDNVIQAYKTIKESRRQIELEQYKEKQFGTNIRKRKRSEKFETFWLNHRAKVVGAVVGIILLAAIANITIKNIEQANLPKPALNLMLYGDYYNSGKIEAKMEKAILAQFTTWQRVVVVDNYLPSNSSNDTMSAYIEKSVAILATFHPDVFILDKASFKSLLAQGALSNLDFLQSELNSDHAADQLQTGTQPDDKGAVHLYGVDISSDPLWKTIGLPENDKIAVLSLNPKNKANAVQFMLHY